MLGAILITIHRVGVVVACEYVKIIIVMALIPQVWRIIHCTDAICFLVWLQIISLAMWRRVSCTNRSCTLSLHR